MFAFCLGDPLSLFRNCRWYSIGSMYLLHFCCGSQSPGVFPIHVRRRRPAFLLGIDYVLEYYKDIGGLYGCIYNTLLCIQVAKILKILRACRGGASEDQGGDGEGAGYGIVYRRRGDLLGVSPPLLGLLSSYLLIYALSLDLPLPHSFKYHARVGVPLYAVA
jgi:hypothetical protein